MRSLKKYFGWLGSSPTLDDLFWQIVTLCVLTVAAAAALFVVYLGGSIISDSLPLKSGWELAFQIIFCAMGGFFIALGLFVGLVAAESGIVLDQRFGWSAEPRWYLMNFIRRYIPRRRSNQKV